MQVVEVKGVTFGSGRPKICVPMVGKTEDELLSEAALLSTSVCDCVEWRVDFFEEVAIFERVQQVGKKIRNILQEKPILFTFRSFREGGEREFSEDSYFSLYQVMVESQLVDMIDVELFMKPENVSQMVEFAHTNQLTVVMCNHDFDATPETEEIIHRLIMMQDKGADICKIAVMPRSADDVLRLLTATNTFSTDYATCPVITMSMGSLGIVTRLTGELFGSCMTFGSAKKASAPGQIPVDLLEEQLNFFHENSKDNS